MNGALDIEDATMGDLGFRRVMIGRLRNARGLPVVVGRAETLDGRLVRVVLPPVGKVADAVRALYAASMRGEA